MARGLVQAGSGGSTYIIATIGSAADSVLVTVRAGSGVSRVWTGADGSDWNAPRNWSPAGRPNAADTARVESATTPLPVLDGDGSVGRVEVADGATVDLGVHVLTVYVDAAIDGAITAETGRLVHAGTGTLSGTLPLLEVTGTAEAVAHTTLNGSLRVLGGTFRTRGQTVIIQN